MKMCVLYDRECIDCGECDQCELDPTKRCNICMICVSGDAEYRAILIDEVVTGPGTQTQAAKIKRTDVSIYTCQTIVCML